jgi:NAD(P)-dependent dehydrogenase (short-subunit alcohol dehydrogenase family)
VADEVGAAGGSASGHRLDATDTEDLKDFFAAVETDHGRLHVLHNQVGMPGAGGLDVAEDDFQRAVDVNVKSAFYGATLGWELLRKAEGKGSVTFTASTAALVGSPFSPLYSLTKGALTAFAGRWPLSAARTGIRVNVICPGPVDTPMLPTFFGREPAPTSPTSWPASSGRSPWAVRRRRTRSPAWSPSVQRRRRVRHRHHDSHRWRTDREMSSTTTTDILTTTAGPSGSTTGMRVPSTRGTSTSCGRWPHPTSR